MKKFIALLIAAITVFSATACFAGEVTGNISTIDITTDGLDWGMTLDEFYASDFYQDLVDDPSVDVFTYSTVELESWEIPGKIVYAFNVDASTLDFYFFLPAADGDDYRFYNYCGYYAGNGIDTIYEELLAVFVENMGEPFAWYDEEDSVCKYWIDENDNMAFLVKANGMVYYQISASQTASILDIDDESAAVDAAVNAISTATIWQAGWWRK